MRSKKSSEGCLHLLVVEEDASKYARIAYELLAYNPTLVIYRSPSISEIDEMGLISADAVLLSLCPKSRLDSVFRMRSVAPEVPLIVLAPESTDDGTVDAIGLAADFVVRTIRSETPREISCAIAAWQGRSKPAAIELH